MHGPGQGPQRGLACRGPCVFLSSLSPTLLSLPRGAATLSDSIPFCKFGNRSQDVKVVMFAPSDGSLCCIRSSQICQCTWYIKLPSYLCPWRNRHPVGLRKEILPCTRMRKIGYSLVLKQYCFLGNCDYGPSTTFGHSGDCK